MRATNEKRNVEAEVGYVLTSCEVVCVEATNDAGYAAATTDVGICN